MPRSAARPRRASPQETRAPVSRSLSRFASIARQAVRSLSTKTHARGAAGERLEPQRARAGEEVEHGGVVDRADQVEGGLADAVAGRPGLVPFGASMRRPAVLPAMILIGRSEAIARPQRRAPAPPSTARPRARRPRSWSDARAGDAVYAAVPGADGVRRAEADLRDGVGRAPRRRARRLTLAAARRAVRERLRGGRAHPRLRHRGARRRRGPAAGVAGEADASASSARPAGWEAPSTVRGGSNAGASPTRAASSAPRGRLRGVLVVARSQEQLAEARCRRRRQPGQRAASPAARRLARLRPPRRRHGRDARGAWLGAPRRLLAGVAVGASRRRARRRGLGARPKRRRRPPTSRASSSSAARGVARLLEQLAVVRDPREAEVGEPRLARAEELRRRRGSRGRFSASSKPSVVATSASSRRARSPSAPPSARETSRQYDCSAPRPTRPRSWCSWASPKRSASWTIMIVAFGTSTPTSITVVATSTSSSRALKRAISSRRSAGFSRPCMQPTRKPCSSPARSRSASCSAARAVDVADSSISGQTTYACRPSRRGARAGACTPPSCARPSPTP